MCRGACAVHQIFLALKDDVVVPRLQCDIGDASTERAAQIRSENRLSQAMGANLLVLAGIRVAEGLEESLHMFGLEVPVRVRVLRLVSKECREAASGEAIRDFG